MVMGCLPGLLPLYGRLSSTSIYTIQKKGKNAEAKSLIFLLIIQYLTDKSGIIFFRVEFFFP